MGHTSGIHSTGWNKERISYKHRSENALFPIGEKFRLDFCFKDKMKELLELLELTLKSKFNGLLWFLTWKIEKKVFLKCFLGSHLETTRKSKKFGVKTHFIRFDVNLLVYIADK